MTKPGIRNDKMEVQNDSTGDSEWQNKKPKITKVSSRDEQYKRCPRGISLKN